MNWNQKKHAKPCQKWMLCFFYSRGLVHVDLERRPVNSVIDKCDRKHGRKIHYNALSSFNSKINKRQEIPVINHKSDICFCLFPKLKLPSQQLKATQKVLMKRDLRIRKNACQFGLGSFTCNKINIGNYLNIWIFVTIFLFFMFTIFIEYNDIKNLAFCLQLHFHCRKCFSIKIYL